MRRLWMVRVVENDVTSVVRGESEIEKQGRGCSEVVG